MGAVAKGKPLRNRRHQTVVKIRCLNSGQLRRFVCSRDAVMPRNDYCKYATMLTIAPNLLGMGDAWVNSACNEVGLETHRIRSSKPGI
jgi:hypothetical protein